MILVDHPEQAVLKILGAVHPTAVKLVAGEKKALITECLFVHWSVVHCMRAPTQHEY